MLIRLIFLFCFLISACGEKNADILDTNYPSSQNPILKNGDEKIILDLSKYKDDWEEQLNLKSLLNGYDSLQIRIWYVNESLDNRYLNLLMLKFNEKKLAYHYRYQFGSNEKETPLIEKFIKKISIKNWDSVLNSLIDNSLKKILDQKFYWKKPEYQVVISDANMVLVEVADRNSYNIFSYADPAGTLCNEGDCQKFYNFLKVLNQEADILGFQQIFDYSFPSEK